MKRNCDDISPLICAIAGRTPRAHVTFFSKVGNGKSSSGNTLLAAWGYTGAGFEARRQRSAVTNALQVIEHTDHGVVLRVADQPGVLDARGRAADEAHLRGTALSTHHKDGYHVIFVVQKITDRLDTAETAVLSAVKQFYGTGAGPHTVLLLTHADVLDSHGEIVRQVAEAKKDVEGVLGHPIFRAVAINNHASRATVAGASSRDSGVDLVQVIHDVICNHHSPIVPPTPAHVIQHVHVNNDDSDDDGCTIS